jgi:hypothetical protein
MMSRRLTRSFLDELPAFKSHDEARQWFKQRFGNNFFMTESEVINGEKMYFYHLVVDRETYLKGMQELKEKGVVDGLDLINSYHPVEISEKGSVHIVF